MLISAFLTDQVRNRCDATIIGTAALSIFKAIPWPEVAGFFAALLGLLRLIDYILGKLKKRRK